MSCERPARNTPTGGRRRRIAPLCLCALLAACSTLDPPPAADGFLGLQGVILAGPDPDGAAAWYAQLFGRSAQEQSLGFTGFAVGDDELDLDAQGSAVVVAVWSVASIDAAFARLVELGAEPVTGIQEIGAARIAILRDPFGNLLGLSQAPARGRP